MQPEGRRALLWLCAAGLVQLAVVLWGIADGGNLLAAPIRNDDSAGHFYSALHAAEHLQRGGAIWGYDPFWLAGYSEGVLGLVDNKLFSLAVSLAPDGAEATVYNAVFLLALVLPPWFLYGSARAGGATPMAGAGAAIAAVAATFTIPLTFGFLMWGGTSFFLASVLVVPAAVILADRIAYGTLWSVRGAGALGLTACALFIHPAVLPILAAGLLPALFAARRRRAWLLLDLVLVGVAVSIAFLPLLDSYVEVREQFRIHYAPGAMFLRNVGRGSMAGGIPQLVEDWWTYLFEIDLWPHGAGGLFGLVLLALSGTARSAEDDLPRLGRHVALVAAVAAVFMAYGALSIVSRAALG